MFWKSKRGWNRRGKKNKKGDIPISELVTIIIVIVVLALCIAFVWLLKEKGFEGALSTIKNLLRFGRPKA